MITRKTNVKYSNNLGKENYSECSDDKEFNSDTEETTQKSDH